MKRGLAILLTIFGAALLCGMGSMNGGPEGSIPETSRNVSARLTDRGGVSAEVENFSMDGNIYLQGTLGGGTLTVPFEKLQRVDFGPVGGEKVPARLLLRTGETLELSLRKRAVFYGQMGVGSFRIRAAEIQRIEFP